MQMYVYRVKYNKVSWSSSWFMGLQCIPKTSLSFLVICTAVYQQIVSSEFIDAIICLQDLMAYTWPSSCCAILSEQTFSRSKVSGLLGRFSTVLYMLVLSATWISGVSEFQCEIYISRSGRIIRTFKSVLIIKASTFQGCAQDRIPLCMARTHFDFLFLQVWHQVQHCHRPRQPVLSQPQFS